MLILLLQLQTGFAQSTTRKETGKTPVAQDEESYSNAIGLRAGETSGITFKHFFNASDNAVEAIVGFWPYDLKLTALYEHYVSTNTKGLRWYYGGGGHVVAGYGRTGYYPYSDVRFYSYRYSYPGFGIGIDGIIGAEYKIPKIPFAVSLDVKPFIEINNTPDIFMAFDPGFGIKYTF
jgi:hypothetical protein